MVESKVGRTRGIAVTVLGVLFALGIVVTATSSPRADGATPDEIADVRVERDGDATLVKLTGLDAPVYTAFKASDPSRIIIDFVGVAPGTVSSPLVVYDGMIDEITTVGSDRPMKLKPLQTS